MEQLSIIFDRSHEAWAKAIEWRDNNPEAWDWFKKQARNFARHQRRFSTKQLIEGFRWETRFEDTDKVYKINNNLTPAIARMLIIEVPECEPYIVLRSSVLDTVA